MKSIILKKEVSVAFTGHRNLPILEKSIIAERITEAIAELCKQGYRNFYCGMAIGFDILAAEKVIAMKIRYPDVKLIAVIPFANQSARFPLWAKGKYERLLAMSDQRILLSNEYYKGCLLRRNDYMLENVSHLIAYYDGEVGGGTYYTCRRAEQMHIPVTNLY